MLKLNIKTKEVVEFFHYQILDRYIHEVHVLSLLVLQPDKLIFTNYNITKTCFRVVNSFHLNATSGNDI